MNVEFVKQNGEKVCCSIAAPTTKADVEKFHDWMFDYGRKNGYVEAEYIMESNPTSDWMKVRVIRFATKDVKDEWRDVDD